jgi:hypothetical protein
MGLRHILAIGVVAMIAGGGRAQPVAETAPIHFAAVLSADEQSAPTYSDGSGRAEFVLDRATLEFSWVVTYRGLTTAITGAHIHGPQLPGTNAGILIDIGDKGLGSPLTGSAILTDGLLEYLLAGRLYVNIHSTKYKDGELRGQIKRLRTPARAE